MLLWEVRDHVLELRLVDQKKLYFRSSQGLGRLIRRVWSIGCSQRECALWRKPLILRTRIYLFTKHIIEEGIDTRYSVAMHSSSSVILKNSLRKVFSFLFKS